MRRLLMSIALLAGTAAVIGIVIYGRENSAVLTRHRQTLIPAGDRRPAPPLTGPPLTGRRVDLAAFAGKPVVVNFFASWCHPCQAEAPGLARLAHRFAGRMQMVAVDNAGGSAGDSRTSTMHFVARYGWRFPIVYDPTNHLAVRYGLDGQPTTFVIDQQGRIAWQHAGQISSTAIAHVVSQLLRA